MIDIDKRREKFESKERIRRRMHAEIDEENYEYTPGEKPIDIYDKEARYRVAIYARVSTDDEKQTTSYELQQIYYEDFVRKHPNWTLVKIYADEGTSGTTLEHREQFKKMIEDSKAGKIDLIITKNVSRFARNIMITIGTVRELAELRNPVGVFFESEAVFSLNDESQTMLSFLAQMAEQESQIRSRSMEVSLRMRLDNGIPLTPKLLGYTHDCNGNLIVNPEEAPTVKLMFYMYLYGYSSKQIADALIALERRSYLGNIKWTSGGVIQVLRNERHCGEVYTRKTFTPNFRDHKSRKNTGQRPRSRYKKHHEGIVSRDDYIAVQHLIDNAKYKNKSFLPELRVVDRGILKGFVVVNPTWAAFKEEEYYKAAHSVYDTEELQNMDANEDIKVEVEAGDFDLRDFEVARMELFEGSKQPAIMFSDNKVKLNSNCINKFGENNYVELLINPITRKFAVRKTTKNNRQAVVCSKKICGSFQARDIPISAVSRTIYSLFGWNSDFRYRVSGTLYEEDEEIAYIFDTENTEAFLKSYLIPKYADNDGNENIEMKPLTPYGKRIKAIPKEWINSFGKQYYLHERSYEELQNQEEKDWKLRIEGQIVEMGDKINVTSFDEIRSYINQELRGIDLQEEVRSEYV